jgi:hypothetical protein
MGFWKSLGKAVNAQIDADLEREAKARRRETEAARLLEEADSLRSRQLFTYSTPTSLRERRLEERRLELEEERLRLERIRLRRGY